MAAPDPLEMEGVEVEEPEVQETLPPLRVKIEMDEDDRENMEYVMAQVNRVILQRFSQAFAVERSLLEKVRVRGADGQWARNADGSYVEDWNGLDEHDMEEFLLAASSDVFFDSQRVIDSLGEAAFAKATYDDAYDVAYSRQIKGTINDKQAMARRNTMNERYVALYKSLVHQRAKQVVDRLDQHVRRVEAIYRERTKAAERTFRASRDRF